MNADESAMARVIRRLEVGDWVGGLVLLAQCWEAVSRFPETAVLQLTAYLQRDRARGDLVEVRSRLTELTPALPLTHRRGVGRSCRIVCGPPTSAAGEAYRWWAAARLLEREQLEVDAQASRFRSRSVAPHGLLVGAYTQYLVHVDLEPTLRRPEAGRFGVVDLNFGPKRICAWATELRRLSRPTAAGVAETETRSSASRDRLRTEALLGLARAGLVSPELYGSQAATLPAKGGRRAAVQLGLLWADMPG